MANMDEPDDYMESHHPSIALVKATVDSFMIKLSNPLDDTNWSVWREQLTLILKLCGVEEYAQGRVKPPHEHADPIGASNWNLNDTYTKMLITRNIAAAQMAHISRCKTAHDMWVNLKAAHEPECHETDLSCTRNLFRTYAEEGDDIIEHLNKLEQYWERINLQVKGDEYFKIVIRASLPPSWDAFTEPFIYNDLKKLMNSQKIIEVIKEEYLRRETQRPDTRRPTLASRIPSARARTDGPSPKEFINMVCRLCKRRNHNTEDCRYLGKVKCNECDRFGHSESDCWSRNKRDRKRARKEETDEEEDIEIVF